MNSKGNAAIALAAAVLVTMVVGVSMTDDITCAFCQCTDSQTAENSSVAVSVWNNYTCVGDKCDTDYSLICNGTELEAGVDYDIDDCNYMVTNATFDGTDCILYYTYEGDYYHGTDIVGVIMCNIPLIMIAAGLTLAGAWLWMRGDM